MATLSPISVRVDSVVKARAAKVLKSLGMSTSTAINVFLRQVVYQKGMPFELKIPDKLTLQAIKDLESGKSITSKNIDEFLKDSGIANRTHSPVR